MFFAELSNTWDWDEDGQYGEFTDDYRSGGADKECEVYLGRFPFYGSYADLDAILQKTIDYSNAGGNLSWRSKILIPAAVLHISPQDNNGDGDAIDPGVKPNIPPDVGPNRYVFGNYWGEEVKSLASYVGFSPYTLYEWQGIYPPEHNPPSYPGTARDADLTKNNVISEWQNYYGFVTWYTHGSPTRAYRPLWTSDDPLVPIPPGGSDGVNVCGNGPHDTPHREINWETYFFESTDCGQLDDEHPSFVVHCCCRNGWPVYPDNLGYSLLKRGAVGTISATREPWYYSPGPGQHWNPYVGATYSDIASYGYYCFKKMTVLDESVGQALRNCRADFGTGWSGGESWMVMVTLNLYGDPELKLRTGWLFCVKDSSDKPIAWFDTLGNLFLKGSKQENWQDPSGQADEFIIEKNSGPMVYIDDSGNLFLKGNFIKGSPPSATGADEFRVQNSEGEDVAIIKAADGSVHIKGELYENAIP